MSVGTKNRNRLYKIYQVSVGEINRVLTEIQLDMSQATGIGQNADLHGSQIKNVGSGSESNDAATVSQHRGTLVTGKLIGYNAAGHYETKDLVDYITGKGIVVIDDGDGSVTIQPCHARHFMFLGA